MDQAPSRTIDFYAANGGGCVRITLSHRTQRSDKVLLCRSSGNRKRAAIAKAAAALRALGYDIESVPHLGHRLRRAPDLLLPAEVEHRRTRT